MNASALLSMGIGSEDKDAERHEDEEALNGGADGARTRDLRRDRPAF